MDTYTPHLSTTEYASIYSFTEDGIAGRVPYYRALNELRRLQTNRGLRAVKLTEEEDAEIPVIADVNELTKQTQSEVTHKALNMAVKMIEYETGIRLANALDQRKRTVDVAAPQRQRMDQPA